jgi:hypothetical protein
MGELSKEDWILERAQEIFAADHWQSIKAAAEAAGFEDKPIRDKPWTDIDQAMAIAEKEWDVKETQDIQALIDNADSEEKSVSNGSDIALQQADDTEVIERNPLADLMASNGILTCQKCGDQAQTGDSGNFICTRSLKVCPQLDKNKI